MNEGFIFNHNRCVACGACSASCMIENKWSFRPRILYTDNTPAIPYLPVINLSLACNHCKKALCMEGCPTAAFYREPSTGAIIIDDSKCIGCKYCLWNCPYDAPKYIFPEQVIGKCHLCHQRLAEGLLPACAAACPTGALKYGKMTEQDVASVIPWFPDKDIDPALRFTGSNFSSTRVIPDTAFDASPDSSHEKEMKSVPEWSLIAFSFLTTISVAQLLSAFTGGHFPAKVFLLPLIGFAFIASLFHLGKKNRAWRAVMNMRSSPLSREIGLFILYSLLAVAAALFQLPILLALSSIAGLILLFAIDAVYIFSDKRKDVFLHSGQAFISGLLIASFLSGKILPFIFIGAISLVSALLNIRLRDDCSLRIVLRFFRLALLIISGTSLITGISGNETVVVCLFLTGELMNRILFYLDFKPLNINILKDSLINKLRNEKERG